MSSDRVCTQCHGDRIRYQHQTGQPGKQARFPTAGFSRLETLEEIGTELLIRGSHQGLDGIAFPQSSCHPIKTGNNVTRGWCLAPTSPAMTPERSDTSGEYCYHQSAKAEQSRSICLSSPTAPVSADTLAPRQSHMPALYNGQRLCGLISSIREVSECFWYW